MPDILYEWVSVDTPPAAYSFRDKCLGNVVRERCTENKNLIPKLVHSVMFVVMGNTIENHNYANGIFMGKAGAKFFDLWVEWAEVIERYR
nr:hypothetical protein BaRGS_030505 [Batillaria attramentaria]